MIRRSANGFTLLEMLVVVAAVALLVAILLPSIAQARRQAQRVTCQTQIRQLVIAWHQYLDANGGRFPHGKTLSVDFGGKQSAYNQYLVARPLNRFVGLAATAPEAKLFHCPSDRDETTEKTGTEVPPAVSCYDYYGTSYKANRFLVGAELLASPADPCAPVVEAMNDKLMALTRDQLGDESRLVLLGDFGWEDAWNPASSTRIEWHGRTSWHNIGFMDGHADFILIDKGIYVGTRYTVLPIKGLQREAAALQKRY